MSIAGYIIATVLFLLAALGATLGGVGTIELVAFGLAAFSLAHALP